VSVAEASREPTVAEILRDRSTIAVAAVALTLRLGWVALFTHTPTGLSDPPLYHTSALRIADGQGYRSLSGEPTAYYPPGYPYALGWLYRFGNAVGLDAHLPLLVGVVQSLLWMMAAVAVVVIGRQVGGRLCGVAAGLTLACWPNLVAYAGAHLSESLFVALLACALAALSTAARVDGTNLNRSFLVPVAMGAVLVGMAVMIRPQGVAGIPVVALAWWWGGMGAKRAGALALACSIGAAALIIPWSIRNEQVMGERVWMSTNTGDNLCIGYNPDATGRFGFYEACEPDVPYVAGPAAELQGDRENRRRALEYVRREPLTVPALAARKLWATYSTDDDALLANEFYGEVEIMSPRWRSAWRGTSLVAYAFIVVLTVVGVIEAIRRLRRDGRRRHVMLLAVLGAGVANFLVPMAFFGDPRFKVPSTPVFAVMVGLAVVGLASRLELRDSSEPDLPTRRHVRWLSGRRG
jgi:4-amino-4-deoxy-L-arabinose transferase-like glycosyltransferase